MSNLLLRVITSVILLPLVIYTFLTGGIFLAILLALVSLFCCLEVASMVMPGQKFYQIMAAIFWAGLFVPMILADHAIQALTLMSAGLLISNLVILFNGSLDSRAVEKLGIIFYFSFYVILAMGCLFWLASGHTSLVFLACISTWGNDSCAYFGGRAFGKHPLFKSVSAKKTWEGFVAGALGSIAIIWVLNFFMSTTSWNLLAGLEQADFLWVCVPAIFLAPLGDLIESRLKRIYDTKDASNILPGHGGLLDRIDGLLLVIPWTATYAFFIRPL